jgi:protein-disulfide isomerase
MAQNRKESGRGKPGTVSAAKGSKQRFYIALALVAIAGIAALSYFMGQSKKGQVITLDPTLPAITSQGYVAGSPTAPIEIIEFGDFECPQCARFATLTEPDLRAQYINTGKIRFRYIDFPLSMHANTLNASNAAACADEQGKFWEFHDLLFAVQDQWNAQATSDPDKEMKRIGRQIPGLDGAKLDECIDSRRMMPKVKAHLQLAIDRKASGTPTFIMGNRQLDIIAIDEFKQVIDQELAALDSAKKTTRKP